MRIPTTIDPSDLQRRLLTFETNTSARLSPDGKSVAFVRTGSNGQEIRLRRADGAERSLAAHPGDMIANLLWTVDSATVVYRYTPRGRELWRLAMVNVDDMERVTFQTAGPVTAYWLSDHDPASVAYSCRDGNSRYADLFWADLSVSDPKSRLVARNPGFHQWLVDGELLSRGGIRVAEDGSIQVLLGDDLSRARCVLDLDVEEAVDLAVLRFSRDGQDLYLLTSKGGERRHLIAIASSTGAQSVLFEDSDLDVEGYPIGGPGVWFDPRTGAPDMCSVVGQRLRYRALTPNGEEAVTRLTGNDETALILDRSADDRTWLVVQVHDDSPIVYCSHDPVTGGTQPLFVNRPELVGHLLPKLEDFHFVASDGQPVSGYAMRPLHGDPPLPTVVLIHGGPAGRDYWRFHADAHYLASLGYLSLHINYRGSRGFGRDFRRAGNGEWGGRMQHDLYDAVASGVAAGLIDPARIAFLGTSYGGYASLLAACRRPDLVRCAVAISAPCDLVSFAENPPPYWQPLFGLLRRQILYRDNGARVDREMLERRSPMHTLTDSCAPILLVHGARDPRVPVTEADRFARRAEELDVPLRYLRFEDEGHHVRANTNRALLFGEIRKFLEERLVNSD